MKPAELKAWLEVLPPNTAAVEIAGREEGGGVKIQFFPAIPMAPPEAPRAEANEGPTPPEKPNPDATMLALMAQNGRA